MPADPAFYRPSIFEPFPGLTAAESRRTGGFSPAPYASLNLGLNTSDKAGLVARNRAHFLSSLGWHPAQLAYSHQVHGAAILTANGPVQGEGYDGLATQTPGVLLGITIADCAPVLIYDPVQQAVAALHAGWRGTAAGIAAKGVRTLQSQFGCQPENCLAYIGTCISSAAYEVSEEVAAQFPSACKSPKPGLPGKWWLDLKAANALQLQQAGLRPEHIEVSPFCTWANNDLYFSHRKEGGTTGRMLAVIGLQNEASPLSITKKSAL